MKGRETAVLGGAIGLLGVVHFLASGGYSNGLLLLTLPGAIAVVLGLLAARTHARAGVKETWFEAHVGAVAIASAVLIWFAWSAGTGRVHSVNRRMSFQEGQAGPPYPGEREVTLWFEDFPGYYIRYYSESLATCLASLPNKSFVGVFEVTTDFGRVRSFREVSLGGCSTLGAQGGGFGASSAAPSLALGGGVGADPFEGVGQ